MLLKFRFNPNKKSRPKAPEGRWPRSLASAALPWLQRGCCVKVAGLEPNDPAVQELFDRLVLGGYFKLFVSGWWELIRWKCRQAEKLVKAAWVFRVMGPEAHG